MRHYLHWVLVLTMVAVSTPILAKPTATLSVGKLTLVKCNSNPLGYCGSIDRPLDPTGAVSGSINIGFEWYPRRDSSKPALGTFLPQEGGPGYSSTGTRDNYLALFAPMRNRRDVLIVDKRGTGVSEAIDCPALQGAASTDPSSLKACGRQLGRTADLYGTALAAADVVAVLDALDVDAVDFYGDSYGTFFGQVFAARYPNRVRSLVFDGTYPVRITDPWFPTDYATAIQGIDLTCERTAECDELGGRPSDRIAALVRALRQHPITGIAPDANGQLQPVTLDPSTLYALISNGGYAATVYRELDAAARVWFRAGDALPLLRLAAEYNTSSIFDPGTYSAGLFTAVSCSDYPLLFDLSAPLTTRRRQLDESIELTKNQRPTLFAPFTIDEALGSSANINPLALCLDWPATSPAYPQAQSIPPNVKFPAVPTLILNGEFDSVTSPEDGRQTARQFPNATQIIVPNQGHVTALGYSNYDGYLVQCAAKIVRHFYRDLDVDDTRCLSRVRSIRAVSNFPLLSSGVDPAQPLTRNTGGVRELQLASVAAETAGDAVARFAVALGNTALALRGGGYTYVATTLGYNIFLDRARWTTDLSVSGRISWNLKTGAIVGVLDLLREATQIGELTITWDDSKPNAIASLNGRIDGKTIIAQRAAP